MAKRFVLAVGLGVLLITLVSFPTWADPQPSDLINFHGKLTDPTGIPLDDTYDMTFFLFTEESGGTWIWHELHSGVQVVDGIYYVQLGALEELTPELFDNPLFLEIEICSADGCETLAPRLPFTSTPFAMKA